MILYRPVGLQELALIYDSGMKAFPARLPQQPIFYPVLELEYARQTASDWNARNGQFAGYVTQFKVEDEYISRFEEHTVGEAQHQELWIPAEEVEEFNKHITGHIKVLEAHFGDGFEGFVPDTFGFQGKNAVAQFTLLANSFLYRRIDFYLEIKRNHKAVFLNYPFWQKYDFKNPGLKEKILQAIKEAWLTSFPKIPLPLPPPVDVGTPPAKETPARGHRLADPVEEELSPEEETDSDAPVEPDHEAVPPVQQAPAHRLRLAEPIQEEAPLVKQTRTHAHSPVDPVQEDSTHVEQRHAHFLGNPAPPKQTDARFLPGIKLGLDERYDEAVDELSMAVEEDHDHVVAHTSLGVAFHRLGEDDRALDCYETALRIDPKNAEAYYFRANILYNRGNVREAIAGYTMAIGLKPELIEAHQGPAPQDRLTDYTSSPADMHRIARPARRILDLNKSLETNPRQPDLFKERAAEFSRLWNYEQAIADYDSALSIQPDDAGALHLRGLAYEQLGQSIRAQEDYRQAISIDPQLSDMFMQRGVTFGNMGNFRQSIASLTDGIRLAPKNPHGFFNRGISYYQLAELENAIADFSMAIQLSSEEESAYYWRGISNEEAGHRAEAIADYMRFLELSQDPRAREDVEQRLHQWHEGTQNGVSSRSGVQVDRGKTDRAPAEQPDRDPDLYDLLLALGDRALHSIWFGSGVDCHGEKAEELYDFTDQDKPIEGGEFLRITSGIRQTIEGDFYAFDPGSTSHWIFIRAWDGSGFYVETNDPAIIKQLKARFQMAEEVDEASPQFEGLFIRI